jgi:hypothetical protein
MGSSIVPTAARSAGGPAARLTGELQSKQLLFGERRASISWRMGACRILALKDERGALAATRPACGRSLTARSRQAASRHEIKLQTVRRRPPLPPNE